MLQVVRLERRRMKTVTQQTPACLHLTAPPFFHWNASNLFLASVKVMTHGGPKA